MVSATGAIGESRRSEASAGCQQRGRALGENEHQLACVFRPSLTGIQTITTLAAGRRAPSAGNRPPSVTPIPAPALGSSTRTAGTPSQRRTASGTSTGCARTCSAPAQQQLRSGSFFLKRPTTQMHSRLGASSLGFARRRRRPCRASKTAPDPRTRGWACPVAVICRTCASMARIALRSRFFERKKTPRERLHPRSGAAALTWARARRCRYRSGRSGR